jgi:hypothetical protein
MKTNTNVFLLSLAIFTAASLSSCNQSTKTSENAATETVETNAAEAITVNPVAHSKQFPGAELEIASITAEKKGTDSALLTVKYNVKNFTLTEHTEDSNAMHMANSAEGQHIHFILDNTPYAALYKPENSVMVKLGSEHYLMSFLSRSYHESIKEPKASVLKHFKIDDNGKVVELEIPSEPALFYSRPKGEYSGKDTENILLDFYLVNTKLDDGHKVEAKINDTTFVLDKWSPYEIEHAPKGELKVQLTLLDKDGNPMTGENKSITRTVTLKE